MSCLFGHEWRKIGGPINLGNGKFRQKMVCSKCNKIKDYEG